MLGIVLKGETAVDLAIDTTRIENLMTEEIKEMDEIEEGPNTDLDQDPVPCLEAAMNMIEEKITLDMTPETRGTKEAIELQIGEIMEGTIEIEEEVIEVEIDLVSTTDSDLTAAALGVVRGDHIARITLDLDQAGEDKEANKVKATLETAQSPKDVLTPSRDLHHGLIKEAIKKT